MPSSKIPRRSENHFTPDYGVTGLPLTGRPWDTTGRRHGYSGAVVTPFYDSMLVKLITCGGTYENAMDRMHRALTFRIRGVKTNIPFIENVIDHEAFRSGQATTRLIDTTPELLISASTGSRFGLLSSLPMSQSTATLMSKQGALKWKWSPATHVA